MAVTAPLYISPWAIIPDTVKYSLWKGAFAGTTAGFGPDLISHVLNAAQLM